MCFKKINKRLEKYAGKNADFYSNLICGILGGIIISFTLLHQNEENADIIIHGIFYFLFFYLIGLGIIYNILKGAKLSKKKHYLNYHLNLLAGIIGAAYVSFISIYTEWILKIIITLCLIFLSTIIMYFVISKK